MESPLFDSNTIVAVESAFNKKVKDPFWKQCLRDFADLYIYNDNARFPMPLKSSNISEKDLEILPTLTQKLYNEESEFFKPVPYPTDDKEKVKDDYLKSCFNSFTEKLLNNKLITKDLYKWLLFHSDEYITDLIKKQVSSGYSTYDVDVLRREVNISKKLDEINAQVDKRILVDPKHPTNFDFSFVDKNGITEYGLLYAFDNVLRYPKYGRFTGEGQKYLSHPLRSINLQPSHDSYTSPENENFKFGVHSFGSTLAGMAGEMSFEDYISMLLIIKEEVWKNDLQKISDKEAIDSEEYNKILNEIGFKAGFPAHLKPVVEKSLDKAPMVITGSGIIPEISPFIPIGGIVVSMTSDIWKNNLKNTAAKTSWLKWAVEYEV
jgi:hypothetical protein